MESGWQVIRKDMESGKVLMTIPTSGSGELTSLTVLESTYGDAETGMRANGKLACVMGKGRISSRTVTAM